MTDDAHGASAVDDALERGFASGLIPSDGAIVVGVSGGQDSLALLHGLVRLRPSALALHAVHVDHSIRLDSVEDARTLAGQVRRWGIRLVVRRHDVPRWAERSRLNLELAARIVRYRLLARQLARVEGVAVLTAHTGDDLIETLLMHLLRGAGLEGLAAMPASQSLNVAALGPSPPGLAAPERIALTRPLLSVERWQTAAYCRTHGLNWISDPTNEDPTFVRNRVRHHLLPLLETYNPSIRSALRRTALLAQADQETLELATLQSWSGVVRQEPDGIYFSTEKMLSLPHGLAGRLIREAAHRLTPGLALGFDQVERCLATLGRGAVAQLGAGLEWRDQPVEAVLARLPKGMPARSSKKGYQ